MAEKKPLGYIELESGPKEIYAMNDFFLNFTFNKKKNWEAFRLLLNILIDDYRNENPETVMERVEGKIHLQTQYRHYINARNKTRNQDFKLDELEANHIKYIEFQSRAFPDFPISLRAMDYFVLGIRQGNGKITSQIWLLASDADAVLQDETITHYILKDEVTNKVYPRSSGIMFISLTRLSKKQNAAGELALFLLGKQPNPETAEVKKIADIFNTSFSVFKDDKEVKQGMTFEEKWHSEGKAEGIIEGEARGEARGITEGIGIGVAKVIELIKSGLSPDEAVQKINEEQAAAVS